jgi:hypothetical protein
MRATAAVLQVLALVVLGCAAASTAAAASLADEVHWTFIGPSAVTFDWRGGSDTLRYGPTVAYGQIVRAYQPSPLPFSSAGPYREARLTGLSQNTIYNQISVDAHFNGRRRVTSSC